MDLPTSEPVPNTASEALRCWYVVLDDKGAAALLPPFIIPHYRELLSSLLASLQLFSMVTVMMMGGAQKIRYSVR